MTAFTALVLAGSRSGGPDTVAAYGGAAHKALIELEGRALIARVIAALREAGAGRIVVVTSHPEVAAQAAELGGEVMAEESGPSLSVLAAVERLGAPALVTTADHALLRPEWVSAFLDAVPKGADVAALLAPRSVVEAAAPATTRTWLTFADGQWSGCNMFYLATPAALGVIRLWRRIEAERKRPWRMAWILGPGMLMRFALGRLQLGEAVGRLGKLAGVSAAIVESPYGLAAVDVDKPADLDLVRRLVGS